MNILSTKFVSILFIVFFSQIHDSEAYLWRKHDIPINRTQVLDDWIKIDSGIQLATKFVIKTALPYMFKASDQLQLSSQCTIDAFQILLGLEKDKAWAFRFLDSGAKLIEGALVGTTSDFGVYDECVRTVVHKSLNTGASNVEEVLFRGKYCTVNIRLPVPYKTKRYRMWDRLKELENFNGTEIMNYAALRAHYFYFTPFTAGLCVPSGCTQDDVNNGLQLAAHALHLDAEVANCETRSEKKITGFHIFVIVLCVSLSFLVSLGTSVDIYCRRMAKKIICMRGKILLCFSIVTNFERLSSTKTSSTNFSCLNGFRFLSVTWVVLGHSYFYPGWYIQAYKNLLFILEITSGPLEQMILNASEVVDSFFVLAGLLLGYFTIKRIKLDKKKIDVKFFIFHRIWRIAPTYYFVILFAMLTPLMGSGPLFNDVMEESIYTCYQYWWRNFLFINNYFHEKDLCLMHTWYISVDMQLYLSSLLVILAFQRSEKFGIVINIFIIVSSVVYTGIITALKDVPATVIMAYPDPDDRLLAFWFTYSNTLSRAGPFYIGFFVGYYLVVRPNIQIPKKIQVIGWCLATLSSSSVIFATAYWYYKMRVPSPLEILVYATFYKVGFASGLAWMLFCCITGHGGIVNTFLSWKVWVPLSKLSFLIYLIQPIFQTNYIANFKSTQDFSHLHMIIQFFGFLCISSLLAMICNLLVESPLVSMEKLLLRLNTAENTHKANLEGQTNYALSSNGINKDEKV